MTTAPAAILDLGLLILTGFIPTLALVGKRFILVPLSVLTGCFISAIAALCFLGIGMSFIAWYVFISVGASLIGSVVVYRRFAHLPNTAQYSSKPRDHGSKSKYDEAQPDAEIRQCPENWKIHLRHGASAIDNVLPSSPKVAFGRLRRSTDLVSPCRLAA